MSDYKDALEEVHSRFWSRVQKNGPDECWLWTGQRDRDGYGVISVRGKKRRAHRIAYRLRYKDRPPVVRHLCDNRPCCNPRHLQGGNQAQNMQDKVRKDRQARGSRNGRAKLSEEQVRRIRDLLRSGDIPQSDLAKSFGVSRSVIRDIEKGRTWRHVS